MTHILIVEDEVKIARFLELELRHEGYEVSTAYDGRQGYEKGLEPIFDLIILDLMLPGLSGIEVCRRIRQTSNIPIIMLTAKDDVSDKVMGLDTGADDYLTKPFAIEELLARIRVIMKRKKRELSNHTTQTLQVGKLVMDIDRYLITYADQEIQLTNREFQLLQYLLENKNIVLSRQKIMEHVWQYHHETDTNTVDVYIRYLRTKIDHRFNISLIHTIRGVGYVIKDNA